MTQEDDFEDFALLASKGISLPAFSNNIRETGELLKVSVVCFHLKCPIDVNSAYIIYNSLPL